MKNSLLLLLFISTFFTACSMPNKMERLNQNSKHSHYPLAWQELLLLPQEYPENTAIKHFSRPAILADFIPTNPGFVSPKSFKKAFPKHPIENLHLWYTASFFHKPYITHYMIMEFRSEKDAQDYIPKLKRAKSKKYIRLFRYKSILFTFRIYDFNNKLIAKTKLPSTTQWIDKKIKQIMEKL